jgi:F0F1-type ATP synthase assembly protein I
MFSQGGVYWSTVRWTTERTVAKSDKGQKTSNARSIKSFQENVTRAAPAMAASYGLLGAILLFGAIGYAVDRWRGTAPWFLLAGLVLGVVVGFYELIKTTYRK